MRKVVLLMAVFAGLLILSNSCKNKHKVRTGDNKMVLKIQTESNSRSVDIAKVIAVIKNRLIGYGIPEKNIVISNTGEIINLEIDKADEPERIMKLITMQGELGFWETYEFPDIYQHLLNANKKASEILKDSITTKEIKKHVKKEIPSSDSSSLISKSKTNIINKKELNEKELLEFKKENPLFADLQLEMVMDEYGIDKCRKGPSVGYCEISDTSQINKILNMSKVRACFPRDLKFLWEIKPFDEEKTMIRLIAIKVRMDGKAPVNGGYIIDARSDYGQNGSPEISITMNQEGAFIWKQLTKQNIKKSIAIVFNNAVYSYPIVVSEISNGKSNITGNFSKEEAEDLATILRIGNLPCKIIIIDSKISSIK